MSLLDCLLPASPPEPSEARVVRLIGDEPISGERKRRSYLTYHARHAERRNAEARDRYWSKR